MASRAWFLIHNCDFSAVDDGFFLNGKFCPAEYGKDSNLWKVSGPPKIVTVR